MLILDKNLIIGGSSGYDSAHSIFSEYILFSYGVYGKMRKEVMQMIHFKK